jgi:hypothetical protein
MNPGFARELIENPGEKTTGKLFDSVAGVFWVDWREGGVDIVKLAAAAMGESELAAEWSGETLRIKFRGQQSEVHIPPKPGEQDITLLALNRLIAREFEIRFVKASDGGDTLAFLPLTKQDWLEIDFAFGDRAAAAFGKIETGSVFFGAESHELPDHAKKQVKMQTKDLHFARANFRLTTKAREATTRDLTGAGRAYQSVREPMFGDLLLTFFHDLKPAYPVITEGELEEYGMDRDALRKIAWQNLQLAFKHLKVMTTDRKGVFEIQGGGDMIACIALHERAWDTIEKQRGSLIAAFARRDQVLFVSAADKVAIAALRDTVGHPNNSDARVLSRQLYQRRANGWQVL